MLETNWKSNPAHFNGLQHTLILQLLHHGFSFETSSHVLLIRLDASNEVGFCRADTLHELLQFTSEVRGHRVELRLGPPLCARGVPGCLGAEAAVANLEQLLKEDL